LRAALGAEDDRDLVKVARPLIVSGKLPVACASIPTLGELVLTLAQRYSKPAFSGFMDTLHGHVSSGRLVLFGVGDVSTETFSIASDIRAGDERVLPTDALIVACMLEDPRSDILITTDPDILACRGIQERARARRKKIHELAP
jgi:hypothetical protein